MQKNILVPNTPIINELSDILMPNISESILNISNKYYKLADIFINHLGYIEYNKEENQFAYKNLLYYMLSTGTINDMQILGYCAEAVIVRRCNESPEINKRWLDIAHKWEKYNDTLCNETMAIGTGHYHTQIYYPNFYNYNEPQYDIIWINKESKAPLSNESHIGLQVKTSINSNNNIRRDLRTQRYCVPIVYFDICNDYIETIHNINNNYGGHIFNDFISAKDIDLDAYNEVLDYHEIIQALYHKKMTIEQFMYIAMNSNKLGTATIKAITSNINLINLQITSDRIIT